MLMTSHGCPALHTMHTLWFVLSLWLHQSTMDGQVITVTDQYPVHKYLHTLAALEQAVLRVQIPGQQQPGLIWIRGQAQVGAAEARI